MYTLEEEENTSYDIINKPNVGNDPDLIQNGNGVHYADGISPFDADMILLCARNGFSC